MQLRPYQIEALRQGWNTIKRIDPSSDSYKGLIAYLDNLPQATLKQLSEAKIHIVSPLALNRVKR